MRKRMTADEAFLAELGKPASEIADLIPAWEIGARPERIPLEVEKMLELDTPEPAMGRNALPEIPPLLEAMTPHILAMDAQDFARVVGPMMEHSKLPVGLGGHSTMPHASRTADYDPQAAHAAYQALEESEGSMSEEQVLALRQIVLANLPRMLSSEGAGEVPVQVFLEFGGVTGDRAISYVPGDGLAPQIKEALSNRSVIAADTKSFTEDLTRGSSFAEDGSGPEIWISSAANKPYDIDTLRRQYAEQRAADPQRDPYRSLHAHESLARLIDGTAALPREVARRVESRARLDERRAEFSDLLHEERISGKGHDPASTLGFLRNQLTPQEASAHLDLDIMLGLGQQIGKYAHAVSSGSERQAETLARMILQYQKLAREIAGDEEGAQRLGNILGKTVDPAKALPTEGGPATRYLGGLDTVRGVGGMISNADGVETALLITRDVVRLAGDKKAAGTIFENLVNIRTSAKLSSPATHVRNFIGNMVPLALQIPESLIRSTGRAIRNPGQSENWADIYMDLHMRMAGMAKGARVGVKLAGMDAKTTSMIGSGTFRAKEYQKVKDANMAAMLRAFSRRPKGEPVGEHFSAESAGSAHFNPNRAKSMLHGIWGGRESVHGDPFTQTPFVALQASDMGFKATNFYAELEYLTYREARSLGLKGQDAKDYVADQIAQPFDRTNQLHQDALRAAENGTFTNDPSKLGELVVDAANRFRGAGRLFIPFPRTPMNLVADTARRIPGLAFATKRFRDDIAAGGDRAARAHAATATGAGLMAAGWAMAENGMVTGCVESQKFMQTGVPGCSIKVGDTWVPMAFMPQLALTVGFGATMGQLFSLADSDDERELVLGMNFGISHLLGRIYEESPIEGLADMIDIMEDLAAGDFTTTSIEKFAAREAGSFFRMQAFREWAAGGWASRDQATGAFGLTGGTPEGNMQEELLEFLDRVILEAVPNLRRLRAQDFPEVNLYGEDVTAMSPGEVIGVDENGNEQRVSIPAAIGAGVLGAHAVVTAREDPLSVEIRQLGYLVDLRKPRREMGWAVPGTNRRVSVEFTDEEYYHLAKETGKQFLKNATREVGLVESYQALDAETRAARLSTIWNAAKARALRRVRLKFPRLDREFAAAKVSRSTLERDAILKRAG